MILGGLEAKVPVIIGSAGGSGSDVQVDWTLRILEEICIENGLSPRVAVLRTEITLKTLKTKILNGQTSPLGPIAPLTTETADDTHRVVAMIGIEPFQTAIDAGAQIIIAGRSSDAAIYAAIPVFRGMAPGLAWHMGKVIECGHHVVIIDKRQKIEKLTI